MVTLIFLHVKVVLNIRVDQLNKLVTIFTETILKIYQ
jgi:hypothetical protein